MANSGMVFHGPDLTAINNENKTCALSLYGSQVRDQEQKASSTLGRADLHLALSKHRGKLQCPHTRWAPLPPCIY
jgi:hypothetical protein